MKRVKTGMLVLGGVLILAASPLVVTSWAPVAAETPMATPATTAEHTAEAQTYEKEAAELEAKATRHASLAMSYRARASSGDKQASALRSLMKHCERLSKAYGKAAAEAREMARMHREMAHAH